MTEIKLGDKYECFSCGVKFYDLGKGASVCPKCGADQQEAEASDKPLMSQSVKRRRKAELVPDVVDPEDAGDGAARPLAEDLDDEDLELDEDEIEEELAEVEEVEEEAHEA